MEHVDSPSVDVNEVQQSLAACVAAPEVPVRRSLRRHRVSTVREPQRIAPTIGCSSLPRGNAARK